MPKPERIAVIGAGLAGLTCARLLGDAGHSVAVFDKGRGIGGRMATRRAGDFRFDHGAVALQPVGVAFLQCIVAAQAHGHAAQWEVAGRDGTGWVGLPGMSGLAKSLAVGLDVTTGAEVTGLSRGADGWGISVAADKRFDRVILAIPHPQAQVLLRPWPDMAAQIVGAVMAPCWTVMAGFDTPLAVALDVLRFDQGPIAVIARDSAKPGRDMPGQAWVIQASAAWSRAHLEREREEVVALLLAEFFRVIGVDAVPPDTCMAHRWRYGLTELPLGQPFVMDAELGLALCGDWCLGASAEAAFDSGRGLAAAMIAGR